MKTGPTWWLPHGKTKHLALTGPFRGQVAEAGPLPIRIVRRPSIAALPPRKRAALSIFQSARLPRIAIARPPATIGNARAGKICTTRAQAPARPDFNSSLNTSVV
jgi:hypothetical protein